DPIHVARLDALQPSLQRSDQGATRLHLDPLHLVARDKPVRTGLPDRACELRAGVPHRGIEGRPFRQNVVVVDQVDVRVLVADPPRRGAGQQRRPQVGGRTQPLDDAAREGTPLLSLGGYVALALSTSELYSSTSGL